jgi:hypothetical protein
MTMDPRRAYRVLGLAPGAPLDEVKRAYRDLAQVWHPDRFPPDSRLKQKAENNLKRINEAHAVLEAYQPPAGPPRRSSLRESVAAVLDLGDLRNSVDDLRSSVVERAPAGLRRSLLVLGLGRIRPTGEVRAPRRRDGRLFLLALVAAILVIAAMLLKVLL